MKKIPALFLFLLFLRELPAQKLLQEADSIRKFRNIPGLVYAVFSIEDIIDTGACGNKKIRTKDPVKMNNRFQVGTNTTGFTAYIAARLVEEKKISWNSSIISVLPELNGKIMRIYYKITLQQLLSQRTGMRSYASFKDYREIHSLHGTPVEQRLYFTKLVLNERPRTLLDSSKASYSVAATCVAACMLERVGKKRWEELVQQYINKPLNINADFGFANLKDSTQPIGHWDTYAIVTPEPDNYWARSFPPIAPALNLNINMPGYITFVRDHLKALQQKKSVISSKSASYLLFGLPGYAVGWSNTEWNGLHIAYWLGIGQVFSSYVEIIKEKNIGIIVMCNTGTVDGRGGVLNLGKLLREYYTE